MGCDIHLHVEVQIDGIWHHYATPRISQNYKLFAKMAGVRNYDNIEPITQPRGLPLDVTFITQFDSEQVWGVDGHNHSWLTSQEVADIFKFEKIIQTHGKRSRRISWDYEETGYLFGNGYDDFHTYREDYPKRLNDFRWVFWFDN